MPIGRDKVHEMLSRKFHEMRARKLAQYAAAPVETLKETKSDEPLVAKPTNAVQTVLQEQRVLSPMEGMPAVNGKSGQNVVDKYVRPVVTKEKSVDVSVAAIEQPTKKKGGRKKKDSKVDGV